MKDKRVLITGATNGIGKSAALELAKMGAEVVIVGRSESKTRRVLDELKQASGSDRLDMLVADLSSIEQIRRVADEFRARYDRLDVLLNNAGAIFPTYQESVDGLEMTFALNHISYFLLTHLLLDNLKETAQAQGAARIVNVSSNAHTGARHGLRLGRPGDASAFSLFGAYGESKLANILFTYELARRLEGTGVSVNAVHPGFVATGFGGNMKGLMGFIIRILQRLIAKTPQQGAETLVYLASSPDIKGVSGKYWQDKKQVSSSKISYDQEQQERLWEFSAKITDI